jgi:hypothetical protein
MTKKSVQELLEDIRLVSAQNFELVEAISDGHFKFPHPWPPQIPPGNALRL